MSGSDASVCLEIKFHGGRIRAMQQTSITQTTIKIFLILTVDNDWYFVTSTLCLDVK